MKRARKTVERVGGQIVDASEHLIQSRLIDALQYMMRPEIVVYSIPNQSNRHINNAVKMKAEGVKSGPTDLFFMFPASEGSIAWLEIKTPTGRLSVSQLGFGAICKRLDHRWAVVRSVTEAIEVLRGWNALKPGVQIL